MSASDSIAKSFRVIAFVISIALLSGGTSSSAIPQRTLLINADACLEVYSQTCRSLMHSAVDYLDKNKTVFDIQLFSPNESAGKYAKIALTSYGYWARSMEILGSVQLFKKNSSPLDILGELSADEKDYFEAQGIEFREIPLVPIPNNLNERPSQLSQDKVGIIVLGTRPLDETTPSLDMVRRVEKGMTLLRDNPQAILIFSGGRTGGVISEAKMMELIAEVRGAPSSQIVLEENSRATGENPIFTVPIVHKLQLKRFFLVTRPTHKARAAAAFRKYPEFRDLQLVTSDITLKDIVGNFGEYLARHDSKDARKILNKIQNEFSRGGKKNPSGNRPSDRS